MLIQGGLLTPLANMDPMSERRTAAPGSLDEAARADHRHPRLTSATNVTLDSNGMATLTFTRTFDAEPVLVFGAIGTGTGPVPDFRGEFVQDANGVFTGVKVYGQRAKSLPTITPLNAGLLSLLSSLINALNPILAQLSNFAPYEAAAGARVSVTAIQAS